MIMKAEQSGSEQDSKSEGSEENVLQETSLDPATNEKIERKSDFFYLSPRVYVLIHVLCLVIYIIPLVRTHPSHTAVLDETHLDENGDVKGTTTILEVLRNDYWGRPMDAMNSHKSWRPFSILFFRFFRTDAKFMTPILFDRIIGLVIHAALAELVSICACLLFPQSDKTRQSSLFAFTKLLFAFHPTHVEAVSNAANRPHILALMFSILATDYRMPILFVPICVAFALTSCETATFQLPAILVTLTVIAFRNRTGVKNFKSLLETGISLIPRYLTVIAVGIAYLVLRHHFDTLSIPDGLIRPAENPYYEFTGTKRIFSYSLVLSVHIAKLFLADPIGFSHEYGHNCLPPVDDGLEDMRLIFPTVLFSIIIIVSISYLKKGLESSLLLAVGLSWIFTLLPISGVMKVGTFIADRIIVASTVTYAIFGGLFLTRWLYGEQQKEKPVSVSSNMLKAKISFIGVILVILGTRVANRGFEWMNSLSLIQSSLKNCPNSAKSNLEMSKIYSGMFPEMMDMDKALAHVTKASTIDPDYCDVHQQFSSIYFHRKELLKFEDHLTKAVLCPYTMGGALPNYQQYWGIMTRDPQNGVQASQRYQKHSAIITKAVEEATAEEERKNEKMRNAKDEL